MWSDLVLTKIPMSLSDITSPSTPPPPPVHHLPLPPKTTSKMDTKTRQTVIHRSPSTSTSPRNTTTPLSPYAPSLPQRTSSNTTKRPSYYSEKPLPDPHHDHHPPIHHEPQPHHPPLRPGTSSTEAALKINIHLASEQLRQAQQAERMYRAMKRAATVHANRTEARAHLAQSVEHLQLGVRKGFLGVVGFPHIVRERFEMRRQRGVEAREERRARKGGKGLAVLEAAAAEREGGGEMMGGRGGG